MANNNIGDILCPFCKLDGVDRRVDVRKNVKGKLYLYCGHCGMIQPNLPGAQDIILKHADIHGLKKKPLVEAMESLKEKKPEKIPESLKEKKTAAEPEKKQESLKDEPPKQRSGIIKRGLHALFSEG